MLEGACVAFGNSFFSCAIKAAVLLPNCAKHTPRSVAAINRGPMAVSRAAYAMVSPAPPRRYADGVIPKLRGAWL